MANPLAAWHAWPLEAPTALPSQAEPRLASPSPSSALQVHTWRWPIASVAQEESATQAGVSQVDAAEPIDVAQTVLSGEEHQRADRFYFQKDRERFVRARAGLKRLLAAYLDFDPKAITFEQGPHGKPRLIAELTRDHPPLAFNLSHAGDNAMACVATQSSSKGLAANEITIQEVGIDIELRRPSQWSEGIARRYFTSAEAKAIEAAEDLQQTFFDVWTRKEAVLKLLGSGLQFPLSAFEVPAEAQAAGWVELPANNPLAISGCWLQSVPCHPDYAAAVATLAEPDQIDCANLLAVS